MCAQRLNNTKYGHTLTPVTYPKTTLKVPTRKLWEKENIKPVSQQEDQNKSNGLHKWDELQSPQFVDFANLPEIGDSFFNKITVIVSTPRPNSDNTNTTVDEDTLIATFEHISLSGIEKEPSNCKDENLNYGDSKDKEHFVVHKSAVNKLEEQKRRPLFKANPVPKHVKGQPTIIPKNKKTNNCNNNEQKINNQPNAKVQQTNNGKTIQKNTEICKKLFVPRVTKCDTDKLKPPILYTALRAEQRKRFDETIREKERQKEELKQMEMIAKKKQEREEMLRLRKQTIHKAQPIRRYKLGLPKIEKRPLTDPVSPLSKKRRRRT